jgi:hypothetical protein
MISKIGFPVQEFGYVVFKKVEIVGAISVISTCREIELLPIFQPYQMRGMCESYE